MCFDPSEITSLWHQTEPATERERWRRDQLEMFSEAFDPGIFKTR